MITGLITANREGIVKIQIRGPKGTEVTLSAVIDTGFTDFLSLPQTWIDVLELPFIQTDSVFLADNSEVVMELYEGTVLWDGQARNVLVHSMECSPLIGMSLLYEHLLTMQVMSGGFVQIEPLP